MGYKSGVLGIKTGLGGASITLLPVIDGYGPGIARRRKNSRDWGFASARGSWALLSCTSNVCPRLGSHLMHAAIHPCDADCPLPPLEHLRVIYLSSTPAHSVWVHCHLGPPHLPLQFCLASIMLSWQIRAVAPRWLLVAKCACV